MRVSMGELRAAAQRVLGHHHEASDAGSLARLVLDSTDQAAPHDIYADVRAFHAKQAPAVLTPYLGTPSAEVLELAAKLVLEETKELMEALGMAVYGDWTPHLVGPVTLVDAVDAMHDLTYVNTRVALALGLGQGEFWDTWAEVQRANMAKEGGPTREDGKVLKPEGWTPPRIAGVLGVPASAQLAPGEDVRRSTVAAPWGGSSGED